MGEFLNWTETNSDLFGSRLQHLASHLDQKQPYNPRERTASPRGVINEFGGEQKEKTLSEAANNWFTSTQQ